MSQRRAAYELAMDVDPLQLAKAEYVEQLRAALGPAVTIEIVTREVIGPEPVAERPALTVVGEWLTLSEAGAELGRSWSTIKRFGREGRVRLVQRDGQWHVHRTEVDRLKVEVERR